MTDEQPIDPITEDQPGAEPASEGASAAGKAREWLAQLEAMIQDVATQAAPVARQVGAKAAELAAVAAVKAGPVAHKAADLTTDYGQRFAEKAQSVAADLRHAGASEAPIPDEAVPTEAPTDALAAISAEAPADPGDPAAEPRTGIQSA
jgi:hypothetical protein